MTQRALLVRTAVPEDYPAVTALLSGNDLPIAGLDPSLDGFYVAVAGGAVVGACGVERAEVYGLLRSAVVDPSWRGHGVGRKLVEKVIGDARRQGLGALYLLTTTASSYFPAFGFAETARADAPAPIRATEEFSSACPGSASFMVLPLA